MSFARFPWKLQFLYINGPRNLFVQIDMVLTFNFRQGLPRKCLYKAPRIHPELARGARQLFVESPGLYRTFPEKSLTKMKGKDHIYLDK